MIFGNPQGKVVDKVIPHPLVMIASDGVEGHPSNAGTYSRVLAQYVREKQTITLMEALRKMTLMSAQMLEHSTPRSAAKGRLQEGADADIVVFDAATITDRSTFAKPMEPSTGVHYLVVGGTLLIDEGKLVPDVFPGRAILGPGKRSASHNLTTNPSDPPRTSIRPEHLLEILFGRHIQRHFIVIKMRYDGAYPSGGHDGKRRLKNAC